MAIAGPLHAQVLGSGSPPLLFVHGNPFDLRCWLYQAAAFAPSHREVLVDLPGYGASPAARDTSLAELADACWDAADSAGIATAVVLGLSIGSSVAQHMAATRPERALALVLSGGGQQPGGRTFAAARIAAYRAQGAAYRREHLAASFTPGFAASGLGAFLIGIFADAPMDVASVIALFRALEHPDPHGLLGRIRCPVLVASGSEDRSLDAQRALVARLPDAEFVVIEGAGHACMLERPDVYDAAVRDFLRRRVS